MIRFNKKKKKKTAKQLVHAEIAPWLEDHIENYLLKSRENDFLRRWLLDDDTYGQIGIDNKLTTERVRQIIHSAIHKIRADIKVEKKIADAGGELKLRPERFDYDFLKISANEETAASAKMKAILLRPIMKCDFSDHALKSLKAARIKTVEDILKTGKAETMRFRNVSNNIVTEIEVYLDSLNVKWSEKRL